MLMYDNVLFSSSNYRINNDTENYYDLPYESISHARRPDGDISFLPQEPDYEHQNRNIFKF